MWLKIKSLNGQLSIILVIITSNRVEYIKMMENKIDDSTLHVIIKSIWNTQIAN